MDRSESSELKELHIKSQVIQTVYLFFHVRERLLLFIVQNYAERFLNA